MIVNIPLKTANEFVATYHRHHGPVQGHKFSIGYIQDGQLRGVAIIGRPVSRHLDDKYTLEVTRVCTIGDHNVCSQLYASAWRAIKGMGYKRVITYILESEHGSSVKAANYTKLWDSRGGSWSRENRKREDKHPIEPKVCYGIVLDYDINEIKSAIDVEFVPTQNTEQYF